MSYIVITGDDNYYFFEGIETVRHYTPDASLDGRSRKRQSAVDIARLARDFVHVMECDEYAAAEIEDAKNVLYEFIATLPKADREELRHG